MTQDAVTVATCGQPGSRAFVADGAAHGRRVAVGAGGRSVLVGAGPLQTGRAARSDSFLTESPAGGTDLAAGWPSL